jgi:cell division protein FtsB
MRRLFPLLILIFSTSSVVIFLLGDSGLTAFDDLAAYRDRLAANVASLEARNAELQARLTRLRDDPESAKVLARDLGLFEPGDHVIKLEGRPVRTEVHAVGDLLRYHGAPTARSRIIKTTGAALSLAALAWSLARVLLERRRAHAGQVR